MAGPVFNLKIIVTTDIIEKCPVWQTANGWQVEFHLNPADPVEIFRVDQPLGTLAVAFQKIAAPAKSNNPGKGIRRHHPAAVIPADFCRAAGSKSTLNYSHWHIIEPDIFRKESGSYRFNGDDVRGIPCGADAESPHVCTDVDDPVIRTDILKPVLGNFGDLAKR